MKKLVLILLFFLQIKTAWAKDFDCQIIMNNEVVTKSKVSSSLKEKVMVGKLPAVTAYITEKSNHIFSLEAFVPDYEARIYGQGLIRQASDQVNTSLWGRDILIEVTCSALE